MNEVPPVTTPFKGTGHLIFTDYGLIYDITFEGLSGTFGELIFMMVL
ncbi:MAG: hypothetical protein IPM96_02750 [Ignavibacteria bacterium]|nr:hypothetical protein [Ignavibacteria bacterium]